MSSKTIRKISEILWQFHNDRLDDPSIAEMKPYIQPILDIINEARIAELESIKSTWSEENAGSRIATGLLQIDLEERINNLQDIKEEG